MMKSGLLDLVGRRGVTRDEELHAVFKCDPVVYGPIYKSWHKYLNI